MLIEECESIIDLPETPTTIFAWITVNSRKSLNVKLQILNKEANQSLKIKTCVAIFQLISYFELILQKCEFSNDSGCVNMT